MASRTLNPMRKPLVRSRRELRRRRMKTRRVLTTDSSFVMEKRLATPNPRTYIGSGKVAEIKHAIHVLDVETVIFDDKLSPGLKTVNDFGHGWISRNSGRESQLTKLSFGFEADLPDQGRGYISRGEGEEDNAKRMGRTDWVGRGCSIVAAMDFSGGQLRHAQERNR
ncbi:GTPase HflX, N-terminal [Dillenia turbinata]|uniref:GTPase HflX, N-terminal n=1 Tax=Dillenia turbinata TaxID=194707 RepID=A0AAN8VSJ9_9MAGN